MKSDVIHLHLTLLFRPLLALLWPGNFLLCFKFVLVCDINCCEHNHVTFIFSCCKYISMYAVRRSLQQDSDHTLLWCLDKLKLFAITQILKGAAVLLMLSVNVFVMNFGLKSRQMYSFCFCDAWSELFYPCITLRFLDLCEKDKAFQLNTWNCKIIGSKIIGLIKGMDVLLQFFIDKNITWSCLSAEHSKL